MFKEIKNKILQIKKAYGLELSFLAGEEMLIQAVVIKLQKNKIIKEREVHSMVAFSELNKVIPAGSPVAITVSGKGVLHKKIPAGTSGDHVFETALPNGNPGDFYMEISQYEHFSSVYIIRRAVLDKIVNELIRHRCRVLSVALGATDLQYLLPYFNFDEDSGEIKSNHFLLRVDQQKKILDIEPSPFPAGEARPTLEYSVGDQYVFSRGIMAFGSAVGLLAGSAFGGGGIDNEDIGREREEYRYFRYFKVASLSFLAGIFGILLINFLLYSHYAGMNEQQYANQVLTQSQEKRAQQLESDLLSKEKFINGYGWDHPARISFYADRIAALVPDDAMLTGMKINPVNTGMMSEDGLMNFQQDTIQITGTCGDPAELNRFVNNLRNIQDFRDISIKSYLYKKENQDGVFSMEIITM